ncbi:hypothetical protein [Arthrobacter sp. 754]|uniref:hypothetical protein n=1 Tax=Arthrobacter sp. 754 TaxID=3156315 RepID=UPI00339962E4
MAGKPTAPADLRASGKKLWRETLNDFDLTGPELRLLLEACRTVDELEILRAAILDGDLITVGSTGQPVVSRVYDEIRKHRDSLAKTISALALPAEDDSKPQTVAQIRAQKANNSRWAAHRNAVAVHG